MKPRQLSSLNVFMALLLFCSGNNNPSNTRSKETEEKPLCPTNISFSTAFDISLNQSVEVVDDTCDNGSDYYYKFTLPKSAFVWIRQNDNNDNIYIKTTLYNSQEVGIFPSWTFNCPDYYHTVNLENGTYYLVTSEGGYSFSIEPDTVDTFEVNNDSSSAFSIEPGSTIQIKLYPSYDVEYFKVSLTRSGILRVDIPEANSTIAPDISILSNEKQLVHNYSSSPSALSCAASVKAGTYYIKIADYLNGSSAIPLSVNISVDSSDTNEYNNDTANATPVTFGNGMDVSLYPKSDVDFYRFTIDTSAMIWVTTSGTPSIINIQGELYNSEYARVSSLIGGLGKDISFAYNLKPGAYYYKMQDDGFDFSSTSFELVFERDTVDTFEYNNDTANAQPIDLEATYCALICPDGDDDFYTFEIDSPAIVKLMIDSVSSLLSMYYEIRDNEGTKLYNGYGASGKSVTPGFSLVKPGRYFLYLTDNSNNSSPKPYQFELSLYTGDANEWNGDRANATELPIDSQLSGTFYPAKDIDCYKIIIPDSGTYTFTIDSVSSVFDLYDVDMYITDPEGSVIMNTVNLKENRTIINHTFSSSGSYFINIHTDGDNYSEKTYFITCTKK